MGSFIQWNDLDDLETYVYPGIPYVNENIPDTAISLEFQSRFTLIKLTKTGVYLSKYADIAIIYNDGPNLVIKLNHNFFTFGKGEHYLNMALLSYDSIYLYGDGEVLVKWIFLKADLSLLLRNLRNIHQTIDGDLFVYRDGLHKIDNSVPFIIRPSTKIGDYDMLVNYSISEQLEDLQKLIDNGIIHFKPRLT